MVQTRSAIRASAAPARTALSILLVLEPDMAASAVSYDDGSTRVTFQQPSTSVSNESEHPPFSIPTRWHPERSRDTQTRRNRENFQHDVKVFLEQARRMAFREGRMGIIAGLEGLSGDEAVFLDDNESMENDEVTDIREDEEPNSMDAEEGASLFNEDMDGDQQLPPLRLAWGPVSCGPPSRQQVVPPNPLTPPPWFVETLISHRGC